jgi:hypothetical protein
MIKRTKGIEIDEIQFYKTFEHIWTKCVFGPKSFELWRCDLIKKHV